MTPLKFKKRLLFGVIFFPKFSTFFGLEGRLGGLSAATGGGFVRVHVRLHMAYKVTQKAIKSLYMVSQILKIFCTFQKKKKKKILYLALVLHAGPILPRPVLM